MLLKNQIIIRFKQNWTCWFKILKRLSIFQPKYVNNFSFLIIAHFGKTNKKPLYFGFKEYFAGARKCPSLLMLAIHQGRTNRHQSISKAQLVSNNIKIKHIYSLKCLFNSYLQANESFLLVSFTIHCTVTFNFYVRN